MQRTLYSFLQLYDISLIFILSEEYSKDTITEIMLPIASPVKSLTYLVGVEVQNDDTAEF